MTAPATSLLLFAAQGGGAVCCGLAECWSAGLLLYRNAGYCFHPAKVARQPVLHDSLAQLFKVDVPSCIEAHHDYFDPAMYRTNKEIQNMIKKGLYNRTSAALCLIDGRSTCCMFSPSYCGFCCPGLATVFFYLSDVEEGSLDCWQVVPWSPCSAAY